MGDHRASIQIKFTMHDVISEADMWLNWSADGSLNSAVEEWFERAAQKSLDKFEEDQWEAQDAVRAEKAMRSMG